MPTTLNTPALAPREFFLQHIRALPSLDMGTIEKALDLCFTAHHNQFRKSGEPYHTHSIETAKILTDLKMDTATICAGLLHDVVEDTEITLDTLRKEFGDTVAELVDGVTKIGSLPFKSTEEIQVETYRKMLLSTARDIRVLIIKLADRLHNLRTLHYLKPQAIKTIANESLNVYVPLAHRLGMAKIRSEMEDIAFKHLHPAEYESILNKLVQSTEEREKEIEALRAPLVTELEKEGIPARVYGRPKHLFSIYRKMQSGKTLEDLYDLFAIRIIVKSPLDCYKVLGVVHGNWIPVQYRFKDYVATPKANGYQSLHTAVIGPKGRMLEVQIRTEDHNLVAEDGIAAHWLYKEQSQGRKTEWLKQLGDLPRDLANYSDFMDFFKIDLFQSEIFVFTPKGDLQQLPKGSSVLDFAFAVHTDLGLHCVAGKVNGRTVPMNSMLKSGMTVEIIRAKHQVPTLNWVNWVKTAKAKRDIRHWLKMSAHEHNATLGRELFQHEVRRLNLSEDYMVKLHELFPHFQLKDMDMFYSAIGQGEIPVLTVLDRLFPEKQILKQPKKSLLDRLMAAGRKKTVSQSGLIINAPDNIAIHYAKCCQPLPGDRICGYLVKGKGVEIHRTACTRGMMLLEKTGQALNVTWDPQTDQPYKIKLQVITSNRLYLLSEISKTLSDTGTNILNAHVEQNGPRTYLTFLVELKNRHHLNKVYRELRKIDDVRKISREMIFSDEIPYEEQA